MKNCSFTRNGNNSFVIPQKKEKLWELDKITSPSHHCKFKGFTVKKIDDGEKIITEIRCLCGKLLSIESNKKL